MEFQEDYEGVPLFSTTLMVRTMNIIKRSRQQ